MIYKKEEWIPGSKIVTEYTIASCIKCDCDDINIEYYEDNWGSISTATCKNCKQVIKKEANVTGIIKEWNSKNHIPTIIDNLYALIKTSKDEIKSLRSKQTERNKQKRKRKNV